MRRRVLSVCYQECLPHSTIEFLEHAGCEMTSTRALGIALQFFSTVKFDLVLINQTVSTGQEDLLIKLIREKSDVPIVLVSGDVLTKPTGVSVWLKPSVSPKELVRVISELVRLFIAKRHPNN
jgi:hypothetical protein